MLKFNSDDAKNLSSSLSHCKSAYTHEWESAKKNWANLEKTWLGPDYRTFMQNFESIFKDHNFIPDDLENCAQKINYLINQLDPIKSLPHLPQVTTTQSSQSSPPIKQSPATNTTPASGSQTAKTLQQEWVDAYHSFISAISSSVKKEGRKIANTTLMSLIVLSGLITLYNSAPIQAAARNIIPDIVKTIDENPQLKSLIDFSEQGYDEWAKSEEFRREHEKNATRNRREDSSAPLDP
jgi:hypothetical protein